MENQQSGSYHSYELISMTYTWTIENFSKIKSCKHYSDGFVVGDFKWRIVVYPKGSNGKQYLSIYLNVADASKLPSGWTRYADFTLTVVNQFQGDKSITIDTQHQFSAKKSDWGFTSFIPLSELYDPNEGYIVDDTCIIEAEVAVSKADIKALKDQGIAFLEQELQSQSSDVESVKYSDASTAHTSACSENMLGCNDAPTSDPVPTNDQAALSVKTKPRCDDVMDLKGLGKIDKAFVPLLEQVCLWHPSLISCQSRKSCMFSEWAFTALGRVLCFLDTTKVKDMMEDQSEHDPCANLKVLWEEVEAFKFDLSWLEPFVKSALGISKFGERQGILNKHKEDVKALEIEMKGLTERLAVVEIAHKVAKAKLAKAEESFGEAYVNRKLGYGRH